MRHLMDKDRQYFLVSAGGKVVGIECQLMDGMLSMRPADRPGEKYRGCAKLPLYCISVNWATAVC
jgi:hypothetical protein